MQAIYNRIGMSYDSTRKADPNIVVKLLNHLSPKKNCSYLDIGCGSGNYTHAVFNKGFKISGIDISEEMLRKARNKNSDIDWTLGDAESMPFSSNSFHGGICILATHHIRDINTAFKEIFRVINEGKFVIFTSFPEQMQNYWLHHYFPKMMKKAQQAMLSFEKISIALLNAGFQNVIHDKFFVTNELEDWFLQSGKYRPHIYLDEQIRNGISSFALEENQQEINDGCEKLEEDIQSGEVNKIIRSYENDQGDYAFVICNIST